MRKKERWALTIAALTAAATLVGGGDASGAAAAGHPAGTYGSTITLASAESFSGYDMAAAPNGTAYIGWISEKNNAGRQVHLCVLPVSASACVGGIKTIDGLGSSSAQGLRVLATPRGEATLTWFHDTDQSINGPEGGAIAQAVYNNGTLASAVDVSPAPSFGSLLDAQVGPGGAIWTLAYAGVSTHAIELREGQDAAAVKLTTGFAVGAAQIAFRSGKAVVTAQEYGQVTHPDHVAYQTSAGGGFSSFAAIASTWTVSTNAALVNTIHGLKMIAATTKSSYRPVIATWQGTKFNTPRLTADKNSCAPNTHDGTTDPSGRLLDASWECSQVTVADYVDGTHAALLRFNGGGTPTYAPVLASGTRGIATVAWTVESQSVGSTLRVRRLRLPDLTTSVSHRAQGGRVTTVGPMSCLPPVNVAVAVHAHAAKHWHLTSRVLKLDGQKIGSSVLDGATLAPGTTHHLKGKAKFTSETGAHHRVSATLTFRTCASS